jgi:hypothetical protein
MIRCLGVTDGTRTRNLLDHNQALYTMTATVTEDRRRIELLVSAWKAEVLPLHHRSVGTPGGSRTLKTWFLRPVRMPVPSPGREQCGSRTHRRQGLSLPGLPVSVNCSCYRLYPVKLNPFYRVEPVEEGEGIEPSGGYLARGSSPICYHSATFH